MSELVLLRYVGGPPALDGITQDQEKSEGQTENLKQPSCDRTFRPWSAVRLRPASLTRSHRPSTLQHPRSRSGLIVPLPSPEETDAFHLLNQVDAVDQDTHQDVYHQTTATGRFRFR